MIDQIVRMKALPGKEDILEPALRELAAASLGLQGVERFELYRDPAEPGAFILVERFASAEVVERQKRSEHVARFQEQVQNARELPTRVTLLQPVG